MDLPGAWSNASTAAGGAGTSDLFRWWTRFQDPVLDALVERARASNQDVAISLARIRAARAQIGIAAAAGLPSVDASGAFRRGRQSSNLGFDGGFLAGSGGQNFTPGGKTENLWLAGFDARWELDLFGGVRRSVEAAGADLAAASEDCRDALVSLTGEVVRVYLELRGLQKELGVARATLAAQRDTAELTRSRFLGGVTGELDVSRAEAEAAATEAELPLLEDGAIRAIHRLGVLCGQPPESLREELSRAAPIPAGPPELPAGLPSDLLRRRPDIRRAEAELHASCARVGVATADWFPRFFLNGSVGLQSNRLHSVADWDSRFWTFGPSFSWPIFSAGRIRSNVEVMDARHEEARLRFERTVLASLEEVENALSAHSRERERWRSLVASVTASARAVEMATELYRRGLIDFLSVLEAERTLHRAEELAVQSERAVSTSIVSLAKALGGGWEA